MNEHPVFSTLRERIHSIVVLERQISHCIEIFGYESQVTLMRVGPNVSSQTRIQAVPCSNLGRKSDSTQDFFLHCTVINEF